MMTLAAGAVLVVVAAAGCNDGKAPRSVTGTPSPPPVETTVTAPGGDFPPAEVKSGVTMLTDDVAISVEGSPSGTFGYPVVCDLHSAGVRCDIVVDSPAFVSINYGKGSDPCHLAESVGTVPVGYLAIEVGRASYGCPTDTVGLGGMDVAVGTTVQLGSIQCTALDTGFACLDLKTGAAILLTLDEWNLAS